LKRYESCKVLSNIPIASDIYDMTLAAPDMAKDSKAGQFVNVYLGKGEHLLPRPISICGLDTAQGTIRLVYRKAGKGTDIMSRAQAGDSFTLMAPLGNAFKIYPNRKRICVIGGGIGTPPMLELTKEIFRKLPDAEVTAVLGFRSEPILAAEFAEAGADVHIATDDGSVGFHGNVVALMDSIGKGYDTVYACGPNVMLKFVAKWAAAHDTRCFVSMEERMACGLGACVGCVISIQTADGPAYKKVCKDGPVFDAQEVIWE